MNQTEAMSLKKGDLVVCTDSTWSKYVTFRRAYTIEDPSDDGGHNFTIIDDSHTRAMVPTEWFTAPKFYTVTMRDRLHGPEWEFQNVAGDTIAMLYSEEMKSIFASALGARGWLFRSK